jgi:sugar transferase (PEP-CTERM system associated)
LSYRSLITQILSSLTVAAVIILLALYLTTPETPRDWLWESQKAVLAWLVCILLTRAVFMALADVNALKRRVLVIGNGKRASRVTEIATGPGNRNVVAVAYEGGSSGAIIDGRSAAGILTQSLACKANEIVVATEERRGLPIDDLLQCRRYGIRITNYLDFIERETNTIDTSALQPGWLVFSDGFRLSRASRFFKRTSDILSSIILLIATLPLILITALLVSLDSTGPVLYRQERVGLGGRKFMLLKFRSMCAEAEKDGLARWATTGDTRITRVGRIIRKFRIDELPQLINVLRGDMSLIGPRPERPAFVEELTQWLPFYTERHWVKPGITGWAQVKYKYGASLQDARVKLSYDLYYVKNHSLFLDFIIALQTVRVILWADGAR